MQAIRVPVEDVGGALPRGDREPPVGLPIPIGSRDKQTYEIICGDAHEVVRDLPPVQAVVTSPPYFGQRTYGGSECEVGREESVTEYVTALCDLFDAIPLDDRGSLWVNLGDKRRDGALLGVPLHFALAMQERGWRLIDSVAWVKGIVEVDGSVHGSYLPEPSHGRLNGNAWEHLFRFSRSRDAWSDDCAVRIPRNNVPDVRHLPEELMRCHSSVEGRVPPNVWLCPPGKTSANHFAAFDPALIERCVAMTCPPWISGDGSPVERRAEMIPYIENRGTDRYVGKRSQVSPDDAGEMRQRCGRNDIGRTYIPRKPITLGWTPCDPGGRPGTVLDPFCGTGTTGEVALKLGRSFVGIDLYDEYCRMARQRCEETMGFLRTRGLEPLRLIR